MIRLLTLCSFIILLFACGRSKSVDKVPGEDPSSFQAYENRLSDFIVGGFVISKTQDNQIEDQGDSLLFTGLALGVLDCERIEPIIAGLNRMQNNYDGYLTRFDPLPQEYILKKNFISRDGASGVLFGLIKARKRCPQFSNTIDEIMDRWKESVGDSLTLYPESYAGIITPSFKTFWKVAHGVGISDIEYEGYIISSLVTAQLIKSNKSACYPIHLETIQHLIFEQMGHPLQKRNKDEWCSITKGMGLLLTDWYCQRNGQEIDTWLLNPSASKNIYSHQRCSWENKDSDDKLSPRIDFLILYRLLHEGSKL